MHEHDLDLIAALADGSLEDESVARALVETCVECRSEYDAQRAALTFLAASPAPELTDTERSALHRDLWTELREGSAKKQALPWWHRWSYVAAGLFVVVGLAGVLASQLGYGRGDAASGDIETFSEIGSGLAPSREDSTNQLFGAEDDAAESAGGAATTTMAAAADTTTAGDIVTPPDFTAIADDIRARRESSEPVFRLEDSPEADTECLRRLGLDDLQVIDIPGHEGRYLALMSEDDPVTVTLVSLADCRVETVDTGPGGG